MNKSVFIEEIKKLNINITDEMLEKLEVYKNFLQEYNEHTNLTAIKDDEAIYLKHFYDSMTIVKAIDLNKINNLLDIGTGAGFPGMVIKIFYPNLKVTLLDSNNKKIHFLQELSQKLNLEVELINARVEDYAKNNLNKFDIVTSRAVANLRVLSELALPLVKENGLFIALKGNVVDELKESFSTIECLDSKIINKIEFNFDNLGIRNIIVIQKNKATKQNILRSYDKIIKKPLKKINK